MPGRVTVLRPGLIVGPHDPTDRFTYWPRRVVQGGEIVAPGRPSRPVQFVDARDLADWIVQLSEQRRIGVFNAVGPMKTLTMEQLVSACRRNAASDARFTWIDDEALLALGIAHSCATTYTAAPRSASSSSATCPCARGPRRAGCVRITEASSCRTRSADPSLPSIPLAGVAGARPTPVRFKSR